MDTVRDLSILIAFVGGVSFVFGILFRRPLWEGLGMWTMLLGACLIVWWAFFKGLLAAG